MVSCYNVSIEIHTNIIILILRFIVIKTHLARQQLYCAVFARWGHPQVHNRGQFKIEKLKIWKGAPVQKKQNEQNRKRIERLVTNFNWIIFIALV